MLLDLRPWSAFTNMTVCDPGFTVKCGIGGIRDFALKKVREPELAFSVVELEVEFLRVRAAYMNRSDVTHR